MGHQLPTIDELVRSSWEMTKATWRPSLRYTLTPLALTLCIKIIFAFLPLVYQPLAQHPWYLIGSLIIDWTMVAWYTIRLWKFALLHDLGHPASPAMTRVSAENFFSLLAIFFLVAVPVLFGSIFFLIPGIWLANLFTFSFLCSLEDHHRGFEALKTSKALVQGRWWAVLWRRVVPQLLSLAMIMICGFVFMFVGLLGTGLIFATGYGIHLLAQTPIVTNILMGIGVLWIVIALVAMFIAQCAISIGASLFNTWTNIKLFHAIKKIPVFPDPHSIVSPQS